MKRSRANSRGFTLVELMVVVVIVGILAVLGVVMLGSHQKQARTYETLAMVQSIRAAEERWRSENLSYLDVSHHGWFPHDPDGTRKTFLQAGSAHGDANNWILLNPTSNPFVYAGFVVNAGMPGDNISSTVTLAHTVVGLHWDTPPDNWYVIQAIMDNDNDGDEAYYLASSFNGEVYRQNEGE
ncbi:MAG TPA: prepilin-type N-terminal cleavage/methylation domain-containing protein [Polyangiaceae bacterium]|nr:prepilin-type N-terminal cleavage/methylation domain-containing protein [Polyangiaceae bacterium]